MVHYLSRSPNAPKSLDDLRTELDSLAQTVTWSQASLEPLLKVLGRRLARIFTNLMKMMEPIIKFGGGEQVGVDIDIEIFKRLCWHEITVTRVSPNQLTPATELCVTAL